MVVVDTDLAGPPVAPDLGSQEERILDAALRCIARWGVAKTTLDDIAREAGYSRATVYRFFPGGKDSLVEFVTSTEIARFFAGVTAAMAAAPDLERRLVAGITEAARRLAAHPALQFLLAHEPEAVLPRLAFAQMDQVLAATAAQTGPLLAPFVGAGAAERAAEWVARLVISYSSCPADGVDLTDESSVRDLVGTFVVPGLARLSTASIH